MLKAREVGLVLGDRAVVEDVSLEIRAGELVGLIGPNGAGKSSLLRVLAGLSPPARGDVSLDSRRLSDIPVRERARRIAYLPQDRRLHWRLSVRDVVMLGRAPHRGWIGGPSAEDIAAVERALLDARVESMADRDASQLSTGERARVLLARALAVEAPVLLADEPAAALDPFHQLDVMSLLQAKARSGGAVLTVAHDLQLASRFMDRLIVMAEGRVVLDGAPAEVLASDRLSRAFGIRLLTGAHAGETWAMPWAKLIASGDGSR